MNVQLESGEWSQASADWLVVGVCEAAEPSGALADLNDVLGGAIERLRETDDFSGKQGTSLKLYGPPEIAAKRVLFVGLGKEDNLTVARFEKAMRTAARAVSAKKETKISIGIPEPAAASLGGTVSVRSIASTFTVGCVGQDLYRSEPGRFPFDQVTLLSSEGSDQKELSAAIEQGQILGAAINLTRELVNKTAGDIYPESFAERARQEAADCGLSCEVLDLEQLEAEKMGSLLAVAQGSDRPPRVVVIEHRGAGDNAPTLALVGKGVTFDSGGLSIKTSDGMKTMKCDMAGAATVLGAMTAIAKLKLPVNVVGYLGLVENMINGSSYKLGDVLTARNGVTIEVLNTDAEGRLVLADVLSLADDRGADNIIDLATLTGACVVALGEEVTGVFTNHQQWCDAVLEAAKTTGEPAWQLPMFDDFADLLKSDVADVKNIGSRWGGAITAAKFLEKFVGETPWVHLDIAGPSFASSNNSHREGGGTGCMVQTLVQTAANYAAS